MELFLPENLWIWLVMLYGLLRGARDVIKKKALEKSTMMEVLFFYTLLSFLFVSYEAKNALKVDYSYIGLIVFKSFMVFTAWICSFSAIKKLPVSFYGVLELSSVVFATLMGVLFLGEKMTVFGTVGMLVVMLGLFLVNRKKDVAYKDNKITFKYTALALLSCLFNSASGVMDKVLMQHMDSGQLQFWFMLLMTLMYLIFMLVKKSKVRFSCLWKNPWIIAISILFVIGDRALFFANSMPNSHVTAMTLIKRSSCFVTILGGALFYKEKNILYRLCCGLIIMAGIIIGML